MFYQLKIKAIDHPIPEATSISFEVPDELQETFMFKPGQHLIIKCFINGEEARRSYSLNSNPYNKESLQVTVKRVKDGLVSNYIGDHLQVGDTLEVMAPQGRFYADIEEDAYKTYFLFAAGSGITPIIAILKSVLFAAPYSTVNLFYGNAHQDSIIFKKELDELAKNNPERLKIVHTLSEPKVWSSWEQWKGRKGRIDTEAVEWFITNHPPIAQRTEYYICGPGAMNVNVHNTLIQLGIPKELVHIEQFGGKIESLKKNIKAVDNAILNVSIKDEQHQVTIPKGKTILGTLKEANIQVPYSCESGICGTCVAKVSKGLAEMKACMALEDKAIQAGYILTCQALPLSKQVDIQFE